MASKAFAILPQIPSDENVFQGDSASDVGTIWLRNDLVGWGRLEFFAQVGSSMIRLNRLSLRSRKQRNFCSPVLKKCAF
jgi:hypothetical protein